MTLASESPAIQIRGLGKQYQLGEMKGQGSVKDLLLAPLERLGIVRERAESASPPTAADPDATASKRRSFWALKDISFDVFEGELVGIIGRNGAGKSTLLKILSRVTEPTEGEALIRGRVASLLEVGTGFQPELTGRENVFLNGAILGMRQREIRAKFDEIVDFAGIEDFIDTPVKRYSSGMYTRLAFAVAAHLDPDILIIDEVLAVGDAAFQKKCLGKMNRTVREGRTVMFVSHNMATVSSLCQRAVVFKNGRILCPMSDVTTAINAYMAEVVGTASVTLSERADRQGDGGLRIVEFGTLGEDGEPVPVLLTGKTARFRVMIEKRRPGPVDDVEVGISVSTATGTFITMLASGLTATHMALTRELSEIECVIPKLPLTAGLYSVNLIVRRQGHIEDWVLDAALITIENSDFFGTGRLPPESHGGVLFEQQWRLA